MHNRNNAISSSPVLPPVMRNLPTSGLRTVPQRLKNLDYRSREYLTEHEVDQLISAAGKVGRHGHRDATLIMLTYRHGLRVSELVSLRWDQVDLRQGLMHINRLKQGNPSVHPIRGPELRALRRLQRDYPVLPYLFSSERKAPLTDDAIRKIVGRAGVEARLPFTVHPHMLRHACGYKLAQAGQDTRAIQHYLGHRNIQHTVRYTQLSSDRFKNFWKD
ncbi:tyrosine-type recombinase/integrase [Gallionella capsiferriformans]|uniref:Integrase family protein n=1 Tax=Gallionella capsiferriformans (strain ES-2) TaxID=395494 RepID=D9SHF1_GALCS|nr:tyrosine-type recombinase/integrase [Gallionella capsiferriformans]ADL55948.1 integrase family protein [Gallionella capsiferriformans ES-2]